MSRGDPCLQGLKSQVGFGVCYERGAKDLEMVTGVKHFCWLSSENPSDTYTYTYTYAYTYTYTYTYIYCVLMCIYNHINIYICTCLHIV